MQCKGIIAAALAAGLSVAAGPARAEQDGAQSWVGIGLGGGIGRVQYPSLTSTTGVRSESSPFGLFTVDLTAVGGLAFRARWTAADVSFDAGSRTPQEFAVMLGLPLTGPGGRGPIVFAGLGRVFHADDNLDKPQNGLGIDLSLRRWGGPSSGGEIGIQGNYMDRGDEEIRYGAFYIKLRIGNL